MQTLKVPWKFQYSQTADLPLQGKAPSRIANKKKVLHKIPYSQSADWQTEDFKKHKTTGNEIS